MVQNKIALFGELDEEVARNSMTAALILSEDSHGKAGRGQVK